MKFAVTLMAVLALTGTTAAAAQGETTKASVVPAAGVLTKWSDGNRAASPEIEALERNLEMTSRDPFAAGPTNSSLESSLARLAVSSPAGRVAVAVGKGGVCFTLQESFVAHPSATCSGRLHPAGIIWGATIIPGESATVAGAAADHVSAIDVVTADGNASSAELRSNAFIWKGSSEVEAIVVHSGSSSSTLPVGKSTILD